MVTGLGCWIGALRGRVLTTDTFLLSVVRNGPPNRETGRKAAWGGGYRECFYGADPRTRSGSPARQRSTWRECPRVSPVGDVGHDAPQALASARTGALVGLPVFCEGIALWVLHAGGQGPERWARCSIRASRRLSPSRMASLPDLLLRSRRTLSHKGDRPAHFLPLRGFGSADVRTIPAQDSDGGLLAVAAPPGAQGVPTYSRTPPRQTRFTREGSDARMNEEATNGGDQRLAPPVVLPFFAALIRCFVSCVCLRPLKADGRPFASLCSRTRPLARQQGARPSPRRASRPKAVTGCHVLQAVHHFSPSEMRP